MSNILEEYLVKIGFDVKNGGEASKAVQTIQGLTNSLGQLGTALKAGGIAALIAKITDSIIENIKAVANADLEYAKLAKQMWVTKETAKSLSVVLKTMGASEKDVAWVPELREQFFRLRNEMAELSTPIDADAQLKWIREIGYDLQSLQLKFQMLKEWFVYYLIKYMQPIIKQFQDFIQYLNEQFGKNLPAIAKKLAGWAASFMSVLHSGFRAVKNVFTWLWGAFQALPSKVKALVPAFAAAGALIMMSPFGMMLTAIGASLLLLEDFFYYLDGKKSSRTLAPMWAAILKFANGTGSNFLDGVKNALNEIYKALKDIFEGIDFEKSIEYVKDGLKEILDGFQSIIKAHGDMLKALNLSDPKIRQYFRDFGDAIGIALRGMGRLMKLIGRIMAAVALALEGKYAAAAKAAGVAVMDFAKETYKDITGGKGDSHGGAGGSWGDTTVTSMGNRGSIEEQAAGAAKYVEGKTGIPAELIFAQWRMESDKFSSPLAKANYNFGGLTQVEWNGDENKQPDGKNYYKIYHSMQEYAEDYIKSFIALYEYDRDKVKTLDSFINLLGDNQYFGNTPREKYKSLVKAHLGHYQDAYERYKIYNNDYGNIKLNPNSYGLKPAQAGAGGGPLSKMYYSTGTNIGNININISSPNPLAAGASVANALDKVQKQANAHTSGGPFK